MTWGASYDAFRAISQSSAVRIKVTAHTAIQGVGDLPVTGGSVTFDSKNNVRRQGTVSFPNDPSYWPDNPYAILSPWGTELQCSYGLVLPGGYVEYVPLMIGPITKTPWTIGGTDTISVSISDYCAYISDDRFDVVTSTTTENTVVEQIKTYIWETLPDARVIDLTGDTSSCPVVDMQRDRLGGIVALATSIGAEVYCDRLGNFVISYQATVDDPFTFHLSGDGLIVGAGASADRDGVYNRARVSGESNTAVAGTVQDPPVYAVAEDDDPASPTVYGGPFGRKTRFYVSSFITTEEQAQTAADALLQRVLGTGKTTSLTAITDPTLDAGDVGLVTVRGKIEKCVIDTVNVPFSVTDTQTISNRAPVLPPEQDPTQGGTTPEPETVAQDQTMTAVLVGTVSEAAWQRLLTLGYTGRPDDTVVTLWAPRNVVEQVKAEFP